MVLSALACSGTEVIRKAGAVVVPPLVRACSDEDAGLAQRARDTLPLLETQEAVDALADMWAHNRSEELDRAMMAGGYVAARPATVRVLSALKTDRPDLLEGDGPALAHPLTLALNDPDSVIAQRADAFMDRLAADAEFQDALCRVVIEHGLPKARDLACSRGWKPVDSRHRALYYFLTEQWKSTKASTLT